MLQIIAKSVHGEIKLVFLDSPKKLPGEYYNVYIFEILSDIFLILY